MGTDTDFHCAANQLHVGDHIRTDDGQTHVVKALGPNGCDAGAYRIALECCPPIIVKPGDQMHVVRVPGL